MCARARRHRSRQRDRALTKAVVLPSVCEVAAPVLAHPPTLDGSSCTSCRSRLRRRLAQNDVELAKTAVARRLRRRGAALRPRRLHAHRVALLASAIFILVNGVMHYAPASASVAAIAYTVGRGGLRSSCRTLAALVGTLYDRAGRLHRSASVAGRADRARAARRCLAAVREPALVAFSTASSAAALPRTMETIEALGRLPRRSSRSSCRSATASTSTAPPLSIAASPSSRKRLAASHRRTASDVLLHALLTSKGVAGVRRAPRSSCSRDARRVPRVERITLLLGVDTLWAWRGRPSWRSNGRRDRRVARWDGAEAEPLRAECARRR